MHRICKNCKKIWWSGENVRFYCKICRKLSSIRADIAVEKMIEGLSRISKNPLDKPKVF